MVDFLSSSCEGPTLSLNRAQLALNPALVITTQCHVYFSFNSVLISADNSYAFSTLFFMHYKISIKLHTGRHTKKWNILALRMCNWTVGQFWK